MTVQSLEIPEVKLIQLKKFADNRGFFCETYRASELAEHGVTDEFVQDNHSRSAYGVVRGLHYQLAPMAQDKLIRVVRGAIIDVAVDIRRGSPTFGRHVACLLSAENWKQMFVPAGFAHGFATLEPNTEVIYKVTTYYSPSHERGIRWNDPSLGVQWRISEEQAVLSAKDKIAPLLKDATDLF